MASSEKNIFQKEERLSSKKDIQSVFTESRSFVIYPYKFLFIEKIKNPTSILFTVPKRQFKKAVDRNLIKRRLKEIYRNNKHVSSAKHYNIAVIYLAKEILPFNLLENKLILALDRLYKESK